MPDKGKWINIAKSFFFIQDFISWITTKIPVGLDHNFAKYFALKKAFYLTALEKLHGDYYEFGVFTGSSFVCAMRAHNNLKYIADIKTVFYGFDSFQGFGKISNEDKHWFYENEIFNINEKKVMNFIRKRGKNLNFRIVKGYFENTLKNKSCRELSKNKIRVVLIDCDLKEPTMLALNYIKLGLQEGSMLLMDDFYSYRGGQDKGVAGAFFEFCKNNPGIKFRKFCDFGYGGVIYILHKISGKIIYSEK